MSFLRSRLFVALVSLCVLAGLTHEAFADCHRADRQAQMVQDGSSPAQDGDCDCVCHQSTPAIATAPIAVGSAGFADISFANADASLPDVMPQGIDHPPQLF